MVAQTPLLAPTTTLDPGRSMRAIKGICLWREAGKWWQLTVEAHVAKGSQVSAFLLIWVLSALTQRVVLPSAHARDASGAQAQDTACSEAPCGDESSSTKFI